MIELLRKNIKNELRFIVAAPALVWQLLFLCLPLLYLVVLSFTTADSYALTLVHYRAMLQWSYMIVFMRSLLLAAGTATICVVAGYPVAYYLAVYVERFKNGLLMLLMLPFWTNFLVQIYAWFFLLERHGIINKLLLKLGIITEPLYLLNTPFAVWLVMVYCYLPFAIMPLYTTLEKFDYRLLEASSDLGAHSWQTFKHITLPISRVGIITAFFLVFIPAFGEFLIPILAGGDKNMYLGSLITYFFIGIFDMHSGAALVCLSGSALIVIAYTVYGLARRITSH